MENKKITITHEQFLSACKTSIDKQINIRGREADDGVLALFALILELELFGNDEDDG